MSSINVVQPSSYSVPVENYAWVDERLREKFYGYALSYDNFDEYLEAGLLGEPSAWVDIALEKLCNPSDDDIPLPRPAPIAWVDYRSGAPLETLEKSDDESIEDSDESLIGHKRERSESDISDYEEEADRVINRLGCQSPIPKGNSIHYDESFELETEASAWSIDTLYFSEDEDRIAS